jgi:hypothetical protein
MAPAAPHQPVEAPRLLSHRPPTPQPTERRAAIAAGKNPTRPAVDHPLLPHLRPNWVQEKHPHTPAKLMRAPSVPVHRPLAGNVCTSSRPPPFILAGHSSTAPRAHHPPLASVGPGGRIGPALPRPNPRRRRERLRPTRRPPSWAIKGLFAI